MILSNLRHVIESDLDPFYPDMSVTILDISDIYSNFKYRTYKDLVATATNGLSDVANLIECEPEFILDLMRNVLSVAILFWGDDELSETEIDEEVYGTFIEYGLEKANRDNLRYQFEIDLIISVFNDILINELFPLLDSCIPFDEKILAVSEKFVVLKHRVIAELYIETCIKTV